MNGTTGVHEVASLLLVHRGYRGLGGRRSYADKALRVGSVFGALAILAGCGSSSGSAGLPAESSITHSSPATTASAVASMPGMSDMGAPSASASAASASASPASDASAAPSLTPSSAATTTSAAPGGGSVADACKVISDTTGILTAAATEGAKNPGLPELEALIAKLRSAGPSEIRGDLRVIADFDQNVVESLLAGKQLDIKETPELTAALKHEAAWTAAHCAT